MKVDAADAVVEGSCDCNDVSLRRSLKSLGHAAGRELAPVSSLLDNFDSPRAEGEDASHIKLLAALSTELPPILVHRPTMRVIDGMHRLRAAVIRGQGSVEVEYFHGTEADAFVLSVEINQKRGLPLSLTDRRHAAARIITYHPEWSNRRIAAATGLAPNTVGSIRKRSTAQYAHQGLTIGRDDKARPRDAAARRRRAEALTRENPAASVREIARAAGISVGTVQCARHRARPPH
jgi:hypothetical protein